MRAPVEPALAAAAHQLPLPDRGCAAGVVELSLATVAHSSRTLPQPAAASAFAAAVRSVMAGPPHLEGRTPAPGEWPTQRELEIAYLMVVEGLTKAAIAGRLGIASKTVEAHWRNLAGRADAGGRDLRHRLTSAFWWHCGYEARVAIELAEASALEVDESAVSAN